MHKFSYKTYKRELPDRWNELTADQLLHVCKLFGRNLTPTKLNVAILKYFLKLPHKEFLSIHPLDLQALGEAVKYLQKTSSLTYQKLPFVKVWWIAKFKGADSALTNCTFEQFFEYAEAYYGQYLQTGNPEHLAYLAACLYTKPEFSFRPEKVERDAKLLKKLPMHYKLAIFLFYVGCRNFLAKKFPLTFSGSSDTNEQPDGLEFSRLISQITQTPSENPTIRKINLYDALVFIENKIEIAQKQKK